MEKAGKQAVRRHAAGGKNETREGRAGQGHKKLCSGLWGLEQSGMGCLAMTGRDSCACASATSSISHVGTLVPPRNDVKGDVLKSRD